MVALVFRLRFVDEYHTTCNVAVIDLNLAQGFHILHVALGTRLFSCLSPRVKPDRAVRHNSIGSFSRALSLFRVHGLKPPALAPFAAVPSRHCRSFSVRPTGAGTASGTCDREGQREVHLAQQAGHRGAAGGLPGDRLSVGCRCRRVSALCTAFASKMSLLGVVRSTYGMS